MSKSWAGGSTRRWRKLRAQVLAQAGYRCTLRIPGVCIGEAPLRGRPGVPAGHAHHAQGKAAGDARVVAACAPCNLHIGDPTKTPDPQPKPRTRW